MAKIWCNSYRINYITSLIVFTEDSPLLGEGGGSINGGATQTAQGGNFVETKWIDVISCHFNLNIS